MGTVLGSILRVAGNSGNVWLSDVPTAKTNTEFTAEGAATGRRWNASWATTWNADLAWDSRHGLMCRCIPTRAAGRSGPTS